MLFARVLQWNYGVFLGFVFFSYSLFCLHMLCKWWKIALLKKRDRGREEPFSLREGKKQRHPTPHPLIPKNTQRESERKKAGRERKKGSSCCCGLAEMEPKKSGDRNRERKEKREGERERAMTNGFFLPAGVACDVLGIPSLSWLGPYWFEVCLRGGGGGRKREMRGEERRWRQ